MTENTRQTHVTASQLYKLRRIHGMTIRQMAEILGVSSAYITQIENGNLPMTAQMEAKTIEAFKLTPNRMRSVTRHYDMWIAPGDPRRKD